MISYYFKGMPGSTNSGEFRGYGEFRGCYTSYCPTLRDCLESLVGRTLKPQTGGRSKEQKNEQ